MYERISSYIEAIMHVIGIQSLKEKDVVEEARTLMMTSASADSRKSASERWDSAPLASTYEPSSRDTIPSKMSIPGLVDPSHDTNRELRVEWNRGSEALS